MSLIETTNVALPEAMTLFVQEQANECDDLSIREADSAATDRRNGD
jgi:hypothetical protein